MDKGNYRIQVTLTETTLCDVSAIVYEVLLDCEPNAKEFFVEAFKQNPDESWEGIGLEAPES